MRALLRAVRRSIALKLTLTLVGFVAVTSLAAGLYLTRALESFAVESLETRLGSVAAVLHDEARTLLRGGAHAAAPQDLAVRVARATGARVTLIAPDGRVLAESERGAGELAGLENHAGRPEVRAALEGRTGRDLRRSATIEAPLLYVAVPVREEARVLGVLRLALPLSAVTASYATLHQVMLAGGAVALLVALGHRHLRGRARDAAGGRDAVHRPPDERGQLPGPRAHALPRRDRHARAARSTSWPRGCARRSRTSSRSRPRSPRSSTPWSRASSRWTATSTSCS